MTVQLAPPIVFQSLLPNGAPNAFGTVATYVAGTTTPQATFVDSTQTTQNQNPTPLNALGQASIWLATNLVYKIVVFDALGNQINFQDQVNGGALLAPNVSLIPTPTNTLTLGNITNSWAQLYLGPNSATAFDPVSGNIGYYKQTAAELAASVTPVNFFKQVGFVSRYGNNTNPGTTDMTTAIQNAVNVAQVAGGSVYFDPGQKFAISAQITVSSKFPVNLFAEMTVNPNETANGVYIKPLNNITGSMIKYVSPTGNILDGGGGTVRGLHFMDDSNLGAATVFLRRNFTMTAALNLDSFTNSVLEDCAFTYILGSAILCGAVIQTKVDTMTFHYCGNTGQAAIQMQSAGSYQTQNCTFSGLISEVNFLAPHIALASNTNDVKFVNSGFETTETSNEVFPYIQFNGLRNIATNNTFNRLPSGTYAVDFTGAARCQVVSCSFDLNGGQAINFAGDRNSVIGGFIVAATSTVAPINWAGTRSKLIGVNLFTCPGFTIGGIDNDVIGCTFDSITVGASGYCLNATGANFNVQGCQFLSPAATIGGANLANAGVFSGNELNGAGVTAIGINLNANNINCIGNFIQNFSTNFAPNGNLPTCNVESNFNYVRRASGVTGAIATGATVTHGLNGAPTSVILSAMDGTPTNVFAGTLGGTTFVVNYTGGGTHAFSWSAAL